MVFDHFALDIEAISYNIPDGSKVEYRPPKGNPPLSTASNESKVRRSMLRKARKLHLSIKTESEKIALNLSIHLFFG